MKIGKNVAPSLFAAGVLAVGLTNNCKVTVDGDNNSKTRKTNMSLLEQRGAQIQREADSVEFTRLMDSASKAWLGQAEAAYNSGEAEGIQIGRNSVLDSLKGVESKKPCQPEILVKSKPKAKAPAFKLPEFKSPVLNLPTFSAPAETTKVVKDTVQSAPKAVADTLELASTAPKAIMPDSSVVVDSIKPAVADTLRATLVDSLPKPSQIVDSAKAIIDTVKSSVQDSAAKITTSIQDSVKSPEKTIKVVGDSVISSVDEWVPKAFSRLK